MYWFPFQGRSTTFYNSPAGIPNCLHCRLGVLGFYIHLLLEVTVHPVPLHWHGAFEFEMVFEAGHQLLKYVLSRPTNSNGHIYAVQHIMERDWLKQFPHASNLVKSWECVKKRCALLGNLKLVGGDFVERVQGSLPFVPESRAQVDCVLWEMLDGYISSTLLSWYGRTENYW